MPVSIPLLNDLAVAAPEAGIEQQLIVKRSSAAAARPNRLELHRHPYYEVFWYLTGGGKILTDFQHHHFEAPALVVVGAGRLHKAELRPETAGWLVAFSSELVHQEGDPYTDLMSQPLFATSWDRPVCEVCGAASDRLTRLCDEMLCEFQGRSAWRDLCLRSCLRLLIIQCARLFPAEGAERADAPSMITRRFLQMLDDSFLELRHVRSYAARLQISPQRLIQCVRERMGRTPGELRAERVLTEAKRLLFHTPQTVAEIAYALRFKDPSHFGHFFKRHYGCTPREARLRFGRARLEPVTSEIGE